MDMTNREMRDYIGVYQSCCENAQDCRNKASYFKSNYSFGSILKRIIGRFVMLILWTTAVFIIMAIVVAIFPSLASGTGITATLTGFLIWLAFIGITEFKFGIITFFVKRGKFKKMIREAEEILYMSLLELNQREEKYKTWGGYVHLTQNNGYLAPFALKLLRENTYPYANMSNLLQDARAEHHHFEMLESNREIAAAGRAIAAEIEGYSSAITSSTNTFSSSARSLENSIDSLNKTLKGD